MPATEDYIYSMMEGRSPADQHKSGFESEALPYLQEIPGKLIPRDDYSFQIVNCRIWQFKDVSSYIRLSRIHGEIAEGLNEIVLAWVEHGIPLASSPEKAGKVACHLINGTPHLQSRLRVDASMGTLMNESLAFIYQISPVIED